MKIRAVQANNRKRAFEVRIARGVLEYPYAKLPHPPSPDDPLVTVGPDPEAGREAFTYRLASGLEDTVHIDAVLEYHNDPEYLNELLVHQLSVEAAKALEESTLAKRAVSRRLGTSVSQLYRLLDPGYKGKSIGQLLALLRLLDRDVALIVSPTSTSPTFR